MNRIDFSWPRGLEGVLTTSWDDGTSHDRRLVEIFNRHGIKGTFNLNSGKFGLSRDKTGWEAYIDASEVSRLFAGHEVAVHTVTHPWLQRQASDMILSEIINDRHNLEQLVGYPVRGMALPFGSQDQRVSDILKTAGILYVRPTRKSVCRFDLPGDFMDWGVTCHHNEDLKLLWKEFIEFRRNTDKIFYLWGHSYEFDRDGNWDHIEEFCGIAAATPNIWFATNMDVYEYVSAWRNLQCSVDCRYVKNTSACTIWIRSGGKLIQLDPGKVVDLSR